MGRHEASINHKVNPYIDLLISDTGIELNDRIDHPFFTIAGFFVLGNVFSKVFLLTIGRKKSLSIYITCLIEFITIK